MVELIPGTTLPISDGHGSGEGRGQVHIRPERGPVSLFERLSGRDDVSPGELAYLDAAVRAYDRQPNKLEVIQATASGNTDPTTGNAVIPLFQIPSGTIGQVTNVTVDAPGQTAIIPTAPLANASAWAYLALANIGGVSPSAAQASNLNQLRQGLVAFAPDPPSSTNLAILPWQWTFSDKNAPVGQANEQLFYVLVGGSVAAAKSLMLQVQYRIELWGIERGAARPGF